MLGYPNDEREKMSLASMGIFLFILTMDVKRQAASIFCYSYTIAAMIE